ncbi:MAG: hypothetical protein ABJF11_18600 [Reichenbachiella sp.]|uniref:hypothetical protein n=1 Tax=Reichenbachiella sp. TaxID=2184521 RepID=UPI0032643C9A
MKKEAKSNKKFRLVPDWSMALGAKKKEGDLIRIHPHTLIRFTQKKWGISKACQVALLLIKTKYDKKFNRLHEKVPNMLDVS